MKLLRYQCEGKVHLGVLVDDDAIIALDDAGFSSMRAIIAGGPAALAACQRVIDGKPSTIALSAVRLLAPVERPGKYLAIGMNYRKHVEESERIGIPPPKQQYWFNKQTTCLAGPYDDIDPGVSEKVDYEVELGVVIGPEPAKRLAEKDVQRHIFGYFVANDVSARDWQFHSPTFTLGKSFDTHGPIGPWIVTSDEISDPHDLTMRCSVNGDLRQEGYTGDMIFNIWQQISYLSTAFTLEPGDLIATGTPDGVGVGMEPPHFLASGDRVRCEIDKIGYLENRVL